MSFRTKVILGILTFLPILFVLAYVFVFFMFFIGSMSSPQFEPFANDDYFISNFILLFILLLCAIICGFGLMVYYIIHANKNPHFDSNQKLIWILILVFTSFIGNIIYYFVEIIPGKQIEK